MKLIKQQKLHYQDQKSDKVYEVDLCEIGTNQYLVNFRYGKRGGNLKDGTKTAAPVDRAKADKVFDALVASKTKKGYNVVTSTGTPQPTQSTTPPKQIDLDTSLDGATACLLKYLEEATNKQNRFQDRIYNEQKRPKTIWGHIKGLIKGNTAQQKAISDDQTKGRPLNRIIWRVGELRIKEAVPTLLQLPKSKEFIDVYSLVWALGRCGDAAALPKLEGFIAASDTHRTIFLLAQQAKMQLLEKDQQKEWADLLSNQLPTDYVTALKTGNADNIVEVIEKNRTKNKQAYEEIGTLYLIGDANPVARKAIKKWIALAPTKPTYFKSLRQLYKAAEFKEDAEILGLASHKMSTGKPNFSLSTWSNTTYIPEEGKDYWEWEYVDVTKEMKKPNSRLAFSNKTKDYFQRRTWRFINNKAVLGDVNYVKMAVGILLAYTDDDVQNIPPYVYYDWRNRRDIRTHYTPYADYLAFNAILFQNSDRYKKSKGKNRWIIDSNIGLENSKNNPPKREEAYPELWDKVPQGLLHLLAESQNLAVNEFAVKAAQANISKLEAYIDTDFICLLLEKKYPVTALFGLELAKQKYDSNNPDTKLVLALLRSVLEQARTFGIQCLDQQQSQLLSDEKFVSEVLFVPHDDVMEKLKTVFPKQSFNKSTAENILSTAIAKMLAFDETITEDERKSILNAGTLLSENFTDHLNGIDISIVEKLLSHPVSENKVFGAKILLTSDIKADDIREEVILNLINGDSAEMREVGVQLLGKMSDEALLKKRELLKSLCLSEFSEVRKAVQPVIGKLTKSNEEFGNSFTQEIALYLLKSEEHEGRDADLNDLLKNELKPFLKNIDQNRIFQLIHSPRSAANIFGFELLNDCVKAEDLKMRQIVRLASHEMQPIRKWAWDMYDNNVSRIKYEASEAVRIVDATWDDSRDFAFDYFRKNFDKKDWSPDVLVSICDSNSPIVQQFGKELITQFFEEENGEQYLIQLSQHPTADLQQFATNYLERFASDNPENIQKLELYFTTVLSGVNKSMVAKQRIFEFIKKEALKNEDTAKLVAKLLTRQSAMMVIRDKARCIEIMRDLKEVYPDLDMPIKVKEVAVYPV